MDPQQVNQNQPSQKGLIIGWFELVLFLIVAVGAGAFLGKLWISEENRWVHEQVIALQAQSQQTNLKIIDPFRIQQQVHPHGYSAEKVSARIKVYAEEQSKEGVITIFPSQVFDAPDSFYVSKKDLFPELEQ